MYANYYGQSFTYVFFHPESAFLKTENPGNRLPNNPDNDNCISNVADGVHCSLAGKHTCTLNLGSYMSAHVLFNLLNTFIKGDSIFRNKVNKFNNTGARML